VLPYKWLVRSNDRRPSAIVVAHFVVCCPVDGFLFLVFLPFVLDLTQTSAIAADPVVRVDSADEKVLLVIVFDFHCHVPRAM